jgi:asparagine synthase (glutamine-hydrolysing)
MCGIFGILGPPEHEQFDQMKDILMHRGRDENDSYLLPQFSLGHLRLSIIRVANGRQSLFNEGQTIA